MKKMLYLCFLLLPFVSRAQPGIIRVIDSSTNLWSEYAGHFPGTTEMVVDNAGNVYGCIIGCIYKVTPTGAASIVAGVEHGYGIVALGDGGPATNASLFQGYDGKMAVDNAGNLYISDVYNNRVRKVNTSGIITTIAGTGEYGFSGDGGVATAAKLNIPRGIAVDNAGNVYVGDNGRIRKISTTGVITTIAGGGTTVVTAGGVPAMSAMITAADIAIDGAGNFFFFNDSGVYKLNTLGIVHKITSCRYLYTSWPVVVTGEGGPAIFAMTEGVTNIDADATGNVYLASQTGVIRKINTAGIISTISGPVPYVWPYPELEPCERLEDGTLASEAKLCWPAWVSVHPSGDIYFAVQGSYNRLCKISYTPTIASHDFSVYVSKTCAGVDHFFRMSSYLPSHHVETFYGDGTADTVSMIDMGDGTGGIEGSHAYPTSGYYTIRHVLYNGGTPIDTVSYSHHFQLCNNVNVKLYHDNNSNCIFDSGTETFSYAPVTIRVDSNGIPVDTVSATSGFYYTASGNASDVYTFRMLSAGDSVYVSCPLSGVLSKTLTPVVDYGATLYFALSCGVTSGFDLTSHSAVSIDRFVNSIVISGENKKCLLTDGTITVNLSPKYEFVYARPTPTSVVGHTITWDFTNMSATIAPSTIHIVSHRSSLLPWLPPGDTVQTRIAISPEAGDTYPSDNVILRCDTIRNSWDPNDIAVTPSGNILNGTELQYTVRFENMGNDTAHNIHVLDTLPDNVDVSSLRIVTASAVMNSFIYRDGGYNIVKFDFPNIMLPDSSHHGLCDGMVIYTVKARTGLAHGTLIPNRAGIYFDDNPVVMTNEVNNRIRIPSISVTPTSPLTVCNTDTVTFTATSISMKDPVYQWVRNGVHVGTNSPTYRAYGLTPGTVISCMLYNPAHDTLIATSNVVVVSVDGMPLAGSVSGVPAVCAGSLATLVTSVPGGVWSIANSNATVVGGLVTGVSAGTTTVSYAVSNACGTATAVHHMTVNPLPVAGSVSGAAVLCAASTATLIATVPGGAWSTSNSRATVAGGVVTGVSAGSTIISYAVTNSCGTAITTHSMSINPLPVAGSITGVPAVCAGSIMALTASVSGGAWSLSNSNATIAGGIVTGVLAGSTTISYAVTNSCGTATATHSMMVNPLPVAGSVTGAPVVCEAATAMLTATEPGGVWSTTTGSATVTGGTVTGVAAGNTTVSYIVTNSCGTAIATHDMTVNPLPVAGSVAGVPVVCEGSTIVLLATVPGGVWSTSTSGATVASGVVTGVSAGNAAVSYSVSNSCGTVVATHSLTVNPLPVAGSITGVSEVCVGQQISLLASAAGGVWSISNSNAIVTSGSVTGVVDGSTTVSYAVSNSCGTAVATHSMMVKPQPAAGSITGAQEVCEGAGVGLSATEPGGVWSTSNNNAVATGVMITGVSAGSTIVSYAVSNSCGTAVATYGMTVKPRPVAGTLSGPDVVCKGASVTLAASAPGGEWQAGNDKVTVAAGVVTGISEGAAVVYYKVSNDCGTATATHTVTVEPLPAAGTITGEDEVYEGAAITMNASVTGGVWEVNAGNATIKDGKLTGVAAGQCTITYTFANSCGSDVVYKVINVLKAGEPILLPNPATNIVTVKANGVAYNSFVITNNAGQVILQAAFTNPQTSIDLSRLPAGVYYIKLVGAGNTVVKKFTKI